MMLQMDSALKRLHTSDNNKKTTVLSDSLIHCAGAIQLLKIIGFHFQASGTSLDNPYVVYPHWNKDELLIPTYDSLRAILGKACFHYIFILNSAL